MDWVWQLKYVCEVAQEVCSEGKKTQSEEEGYRHWIRQQEDDCRSLEEIVQAEARLLRANWAGNEDVWNLYRKWGRVEARSITQEGFSIVNIWRQPHICYPYGKNMYKTSEGY